MEPFRQPNSLQHKTWLPKEFLVQDSLVAAMLDLSQPRNTKNTVGKNGVWKQNIDFESRRNWADRESDETKILPAGKSAILSMFNG